jgi:anion-transporting  ArsA/GET3 family ATPase
MFIRVVGRKLKYDTALDIKLLESYRLTPEQAPKHRFVKNWTIRQSDIWAMGDTFLDDVEWDLDMLAPESEQKKILAKVKQILRRAQSGKSNDL